MRELGEVRGQVVAREVGDQFGGDAGVDAVREVGGEAEDVGGGGGVVEVGVEVEAAEQAEGVGGEVAAGVRVELAEAVVEEAGVGVGELAGVAEGAQGRVAADGAREAAGVEFGGPGELAALVEEGQRAAEVVGDHGVAGGGGEARERCGAAGFVGPGDDVVAVGPLVEERVAVPQPAGGARAREAVADACDPAAESVVTILQGRAGRGGGGAELAGGGEGVVPGLTWRIGQVGSSPAAGGLVDMEVGAAPVIAAVTVDLRRAAGDQAVLERAAVRVAVPPAEQVAGEVTGLLVAVAVALDVDRPGKIGVGGAREPGVGFKVGGARELEAGEAAVVVDEAEVGAEGGADPDGLVSPAPIELSETRLATLLPRRTFRALARRRIRAPWRSLGPGV